MQRAEPSASSRVEPGRSPISERAARLWLIAIVGGSTLLSLAFGALNPLFEAPDEHHHYFTAEYIATERALPFVGPEPDGWLRQEAAQPPLYYLLGAALIAPLDLDPAASREEVRFNPFVRLGDPTTQGNNINAFIHGSEEAFPWQGYALAGHLLRILSTVFAAGTLVCVYAAGRLIWPDSAEIALLATALTGFLPQFVFISSVISNDMLIVFLASAGLWQLVRLWLRPVSRLRLLLLGVTIGLAALTKTQGILLLGLALLVLGWRVWRRRDWRLAGQTLLLVVGPVLMLAGWLWVRNWRLYGDPTAANQFVALAGGDRGFSLLQALDAYRGAWATFFGRFGWSNVPLPDWLYALWFLIIAVAVAGALMTGARRLLRPASQPQRNTPSPAPWLALWVLVVFAALVRFTMQTPGSQGRLLFPVLLPLALGAAWGVAQWRRRWLTLCVGGTAAVTAVAGLWLGQLPAFQLPALLDAVPPTADVIALDMGAGLTLVATEMQPVSAEPGDLVTATLYWQRDAETTPSLPVRYELLGRDLRQVGVYEGYHGRGQFPAELWPDGVIVAETVQVPLSAEATVPTALRLYAQVADGPAHVVATGKAIPAAWPDASETIQATIGDDIQLVDTLLIGLAVTPGAPVIAQPGGTVDVGVTWQTRAAPGRHLTTLVHLLDADGALVAQGDAPPLSGDYPTTLWQAGERFGDRYAVTLPADVTPGTYTVWIGMYDSETVERLPLRVNGERRTDDVLPIGRITVPDTP